MLTCHVRPSEQHEAVKRHVVLDGVAVGTDHPIRPQTLQNKLAPAAAAAIAAAADASGSSCSLLLLLPCDYHLLPAS
jgi:hypothetical protein